MAFVYAKIVSSWDDQLLPKRLMEQFNTLPSQCRYIELNSYMDCFNQTLAQVLKMGFVRRTINKMADKMATACWFALVDTLT